MRASVHPRSALLIDLYEVTMACGIWKAGMSDHEAAFHVTFRESPFDGQYTVACGLAEVVELVREFRFGDSDIDYLAGRVGNDGNPLFAPLFLEYLRTLQLSCNIDAIPEGTLVFPHEPLVRVSGPIIECQLLESALLNILCFQSLVATKATRICLAAENSPVIEFGLRRAQGQDGALSASRAAYIGGCAATSNLLAGERFGIPVSGTQAHSWIMFFESEPEAFRQYAEAMPNNCVFLVDTYNSVEGVRRAIAASTQLRRNGHEMIGVRLDSGDRVALSIATRAMLDEAGFPQAKIVCSGDLDEFSIAQMKRSGARIDIWGVGTRLATGSPDAAIGGTYKLGAVRRPHHKWQYRIKLSDDPHKVSCPGLLQIRRFYQADGEMIADAIYELDHGIDEPCVTIDLATRDQNEIRGAAHYSDLLLPIFREGRLSCELPEISATRDYARQQVERAPAGVVRLHDPEKYPVGLEGRLDGLRSKVRTEARSH